MPPEWEPTDKAQEEHAHSQAEILAFIGQKLRDGAYDELGNKRIDTIIFDDGQGHRLEHTIAAGEAEAIERAMWSAGEDTAFVSLRAQIYKALVEAGFNMEAKPFDVAVSLKHNEPEQ